MIPLSSIRVNPAPQPSFNIPVVSAVKQTVTPAERKRRDPETNLINDRLRKLLDDHWLSDSGPPARPSSSDLVAFEQIHKNLGPSSRRSKSKLLPSIPPHLRPNEIRFSAERDYIGRHTTWNKAMAAHFVCLHVLPDFQNTICLPEGKAHDADHLARSVLSKVYRIFGDLYETEDDKKRRRRAQKCTQNRILVSTRIVL